LPKLLRRANSMTTPAMPPEDSNSRWVDGTLESGADSGSPTSSDGRQPGEEGTGVEIGQGEPSTFEPEEEVPPTSAEE
jgi:hypothetical protein